MNEERLIDLESAQAFQEKTIGELSAVILTQQKEIDALKTQVRRILARMAQAEAAGGTGHAVSEPEPPPPHY